MAFPTNLEIMPHLKGGNDVGEVTEKYEKWLVRGVNFPISEGQDLMKEI